MTLPLKPGRGGFLRPFGCGWFIKQFLLGNGPHGSPRIDPAVGSCQSDIRSYYKDSLRMATALDRATREEEKRAGRENRPIDPERIERLTRIHLDRMPIKQWGCRAHSFVVYFSNLQRLGWLNQADVKKPRRSRIITMPANRGGTTA